jgi:hypothetical protein
MLGNLQVRFGGRRMETCYGNIIRRHASILHIPTELIKKAFKDNFEELELLSKEYPELDYPLNVLLKSIIFYIMPQK